MLIKPLTSLPTPQLNSPAHPSSASCLVISTTLKILTLPKAQFALPSFPSFLPSFYAKAIRPTTVHEIQSSSLSRPPFLCCCKKLEYHCDLTHNCALEWMKKAINAETQCLWRKKKKNSERRRKSSIERGTKGFSLAASERCARLFFALHKHRKKNNTRKKKEKRKKKNF